MKGSSGLLSPHSQVVGIILAAGEGKRFGGNKQLAKVGDSRLIERCVRSFSSSQLKRTFAVLGARAEEILPFISASGVSSVINRQWQSGIGASIKAGLSAVEALGDKGTTALLIAVADQPHMNSQHIDKMLALHAAAPSKIIASGYSGNTGTPVIFPRNYFDELSTLPDGVGAKSVIHAHEDFVHVVVNELLALDIDTPKDLENFTEEVEIRKPSLSRTDYAY